jgi:hypothetical protein
MTKLVLKKSLTKMGMMMMATPLSLRPLMPTVRMGTTSNLSQKQKILANA